MAGSQKLSFLVISCCFANLVQSQYFSERFLQNTLCVRGARPGTQRRCFPGRSASDCPPNWRGAHTQNLLMCWATPNVCCEQEDLPPPPPKPPGSRLNHEQCGLIVTSRIALGQDAVRCQSPWQASLRQILDPSRGISIANSNHVAGGVLIQSRWILTTPLSALLAGRQRPIDQFQDTMFVSLGDYNHADSDGFEQFYRVRQVFFHEGFGFPTNTDFVSVIIENQDVNDPVWHENAFALIELQDEVRMTDCIRPVCMPDGNEERCPNKTCKLTGWGADENQELRDILQEAEMTVLGREACEAIEYYRDGTEVTYPARTGCIANINGSFACVGDFGGPVVCEGNTVTDRRMVEGLALTEVDCDNSVVPSRVSLVREAMPWIERIILENS